MASVIVSDLAPLGTTFFFDSESYLQEMQQAELASVQGGATPTSTVLVSSPSGKVIGGILGAAFVGGIGVGAARVIYIHYQHN